MEERGPLEKRRLNLAEVIEGLRKIPKVAPGDLRQIVELFAQTAGELAEAHGRGVVHGQLEPRSIMISSDGQAQVQNYSAARIEEGPDEAEIEVEEESSLAYRSPEQVADVMPSISPSSDVFSLGVILYEVLTGRRPFIGRTRGELALGILFSDPEFDVPDKLRAPVELMAVCARALEKNPAMRYEGMAEMASDLRRFLAGEHLIVEPEHVLPAAMRSEIPNAGWKVFSVFCLVGMVTLGAHLLDYRRTEGLAEDRMRKVAQDREQFQEEIAAVEVELEDERRASYLSGLAAATLALDPSGDADALRRLDNVPNEFAGWELHHLRLEADPARRTWQFEDASVRCIASSGEWIALGRDDGRIQICAGSAGEFVQLLEAHTAALQSLAFDASGKQLLSHAEDGSLRLWSTESWELSAECTTASSPISSCGFQAATERIVIVHADGQFAHWRPGTEQPSASGSLARKAASQAAAGDLKSSGLSADGERIFGLFASGPALVWSARDGRLLASLDETAPSACALDADGQRLVSAAYDGLLRVYAVEGGQALRSFQGSKGSSDRRLRRVSALAFDPSGELLVAAAGDRKLRVIEVQSGRTIALLRGHRSGLSQVAFSADGRQLLSTSEDGVARLWYVGPCGSSNALEHSRGSEGLAAMNDDGTRVAAVMRDGFLRVWNALDGQLQRGLPDSIGPITALAYEPGSERLVFAKPSGGLWAVDPATAATLEILSDLPSPISALALRPDGQRIALACTAQEGGDALRVHAYPSGELLLEIELGESPVGSMAYDASGEHLLNVADGRAHVWDAETGELLFADDEAVEPTGATEDGPLCITPDGRFFASVTDQAILLREMEKGEFVASLPTRGVRTHSLAFDPESRRLISGGDDGAVRIWEVPSGALLATLREHLNTVRTVAFDPTGTRILSAASDAILLWETAVERAFQMSSSAARAQRAGPTLDALFASHLFVADVLAAIEGDANLDEAFAATLRRLAGTRSDPSAAELRQVAWSSLRQPFASPGVFDDALRRSEAALQQEPASRAGLATRGVALYRLQRYSQALDDLTRSDELARASSAGPPRGVELLFSALCHYHLGNLDDARRTYEEARGLLADRNDPDIAGYLEEARKLID